MASPRLTRLNSVFQALKRTERRYRAADYADLRLRQRWLRGDPSAPFSERVLPVSPEPDAIDSVLIFKPDEIGDAVHALPAVAQLREHLPEARFFLLCRPLTAPLYDRSGLFDEIATYEPGPRLLPAPHRVRSALRSLSIQDFDLSVFLRTSPGKFREFLAVPSRARVHPLDPRMRSSSVYRPTVSLWTDERRHQALQNLEIASAITGRSPSFDDVTFPTLRWEEQDRMALARAFGTDDPGPFVVIHPFADEETRRYPAEYWPSLLRLLAAELEVTWVAIGARDDGRLPEIPGLVQTQGSLDLMQSAYLLSRASGFIGNVSGPAHLAAALEVPTVALMSGYCLPVDQAPLGDSLVIRADVPCAPCHQATCPVYGLACLTELRPDRIAPEVAAFLAPGLASRRKSCVAR